MKSLIVMIVGNLPKPFGGVATHCYFLSQELYKNSIDVIFVDTHLNKEKFIPFGIKYYTVTFSIKDICQNIFRPILFTTIIREILKFKQYAGFREIFMTIKTCLKVIDVGKKHNIDIIHSQHCLLRSLAAVIAAKSLRKPVVITIHGSEFSYEPIFNKYRGPIEYNTKEATAVIAVSNFTKGKIIKSEVRKTVCVVPNGVDLDKYRPLTAFSRGKMNRRKRIILCVAQLSKRKGVDVLLKSIPLLNNKNVKVWIIGPPGDSKKELCDLVERLKIQKVVFFLGEIKSKDMAKFYNSADIFVLPTIWETEGFGLVSLEAMACGIPVVASKIGAIPEVVIDGRTGILVTPNKPKELARALNILIENGEKRMVMGRFGRKVASSSYSWQRMAEMTTEVYLKCLHLGGVR